MILLFLDATVTASIDFTRFILIPVAIGFTLMFIPIATIHDARYPGMVTPQIL